jgi:hypothetical protein
MTCSQKAAKRRFGTTKPWKCRSMESPKAGFPPFPHSLEIPAGLPHYHGYGDDYHLSEDRQSPPKTRHQSHSHRKGLVNHLPGLKRKGSPVLSLAALEMRHPALSSAVPIAVGVVVVIAGAFQFTAWKARQLDSCRDASGPGTLLTGHRRCVAARSAPGAALQPVLRGLMANLLVIGVMDLRAMAVVAGAIMVERVARAIGAVIIGTGLFLIARAAGLA